MGFSEKIKRLLFPPRCVFCRGILEEGHICAGCEAALPRCGDVGSRGGEFFSRCVAPLYYQDTVRRALLRFKFNGRTSCAPAFAELMAETVRQELDGEYNLVTWVPVSAKRLRKRGYDQSKLLAERTAALLGAELTPLLRKVRHTRANSTLEGREARAANILGAYEVTEPQKCAGRRVLLIDDIYTTGATMSECSRMLLMAGAEDVVCAVAAAKRNHRKNLPRIRV